MENFHLLSVTFINTDQKQVNKTWHLNMADKKKIKLLNKMENLILY